MVQNGDKVTRSRLSEAEIDKSPLHSNSSSCLSAKLQWMWVNEYEERELSFKSPYTLQDKSSI